jgi:glutathione synthase/RimK-type ligase-like ATP-grasp enzyme
VIGILAPDADVHARAVAWELSRRGVECVVVDTRQAHESRWSWRVGAAPQIRTARGTTIRFGDLTALWLRRPVAVRPPGVVRHPDERTFVRSEWRHVLDALVAETAALVVNRPEAEARATKPRQLEEARRAGLAVPDTLVSNDPGQVLDFVAEHRGDVVHKALSAPAHVFAETRRWHRDDQARLATLPLAPVVFQEHVRGPFDVRATVVGSQVLAARFSTAGSPVDARLDLAAPCERYDLPAEVASGLLRCMAGLGLSFGAADLKVDDDGRHVFLEVNPGGQFLFVEILTGLPISAAVADLLASA